MQSLEGQIVLVTGATGAIGQAICASLVAEGARVIIHYGCNRAAARTLLDRLGGQGFCIAADLSDPLAPTRLWDEAEAQAGRITALVNNAGIRSEVSVDAPLADWHATWSREIQVNLLAAVDLTRAAIRHFRTQGGGRILNMASRAGQRGYSANALAYGATKAALINLTKSIAQSHGAEGITALALAPAGFAPKWPKPSLPSMARRRPLRASPWAGWPNPPRSAIWWPSACAPVRFR